MRLFAFAGLGMVLGYLYFAWVRRSTGQSQGAPLAGPSVAAMAARLMVFALVLGVLLYRFGPPAGIAALVGAAITRVLMARAEGKPRGN